jgi:hypothetical protein
MLKPNLQCGVLGTEDFEKVLGYENRIFVNVVSALLKEAPECSIALFTR